MPSHHAAITRVGGPGRKSLINSRCLVAVRQVNTKAGLRIYLVDNKQGGVDSRQPVVYCAELKLLRGILSYFLNLAGRKCSGGGYLLGVLRNAITSYLDQQQPRSGGSLWTCLLFVLFSFVL